MRTLIWICNENNNNYYNTSCRDMLTIAELSPYYNAYYNYNVYAKIMLI